MGTYYSTYSSIQYKSNRKPLFTNEYTSARKQICYSDRMFVRVTMDGRTLLEMFTENVEGYSELIGEVRRRMHGFSGLTKVWMRNHSQGWADEKTVMFYAPKRNPSAIARWHTTEHKKMLAPWETH